jgi:hypothetical protein
MESLQPRLSVIFSFTVYHPFSKYACVGLALVEKVPSPKDQKYDKLVPMEESVKYKVS